MPKSEEASPERFENQPSWRRGLCKAEVVENTVLATNTKERETYPPKPSKGNGRKKMQCRKGCRRCDTKISGSK